MSNSLAEFGYDIGIEAQEGDHEGDLPLLVTIFPFVWKFGIHVYLVYEGIFDFICLDILWEVAVCKLKAKKR